MHQSVKSSSSLGTVHSQQLRYFTPRGIHVCPRKLFVTHLIQFITHSLSLRLEVILTIDANEHALSGRCAKQLQRLGLAEAHYRKFGPEGGPVSYFRGRHQIDGIWCTRNVIPTAVTLCPFYFEAEDHRACILDFKLTSMLGELSVLLHVTKKRQLICSSEITVKKYLTRAEKQLTLHRIPHKIQQLIATWHSISSDRHKIKLNNIDSLTTDLLLNAEKNCRKFRIGMVDYSLETALAGKRVCFWKLIAMQTSEKDSCAELIHLAEWLNISELFTLRVEFIKLKVSATKQDYLCHKYSAHSKRSRCLLSTQQAHKLTNEKLKEMCKKCARTFGKNKAMSISKVEYSEQGCIMQVTSQHLMEKAIMKENSYRFILAHSSPLLQEDSVSALGYSGEGPMSKNILQNRSALETKDEGLKELLLLFHDSPHSTEHPHITTDQ